MMCYTDDRPCNSIGHMQFMNRVGCVSSCISGMNSSWDTNGPHPSYIFKGPEDMTLCPGLW